MSDDRDWPARFEAEARERQDARRLKLSAIAFEVDAIRANATRSGVDSDRRSPCPGSRVE
jgi:hypothetical protein